MSLLDKEKEKYLVEGCVKGKRSAQKELYETMYGRMMGVCLRYARNREEAKDLLHDGFMKVFENIGKYNFKGSLEGWVRRLIVNNAIDQYRRNKKEYELIDDQAVVSDYDHGDFEEGNENEPDYNTLKIEDVLARVQDLPPSYRMVFNLYIVEGLTHQEIGNRLGISEGTSKSNLAKAKMKLKKLLSHLIIA